MKKISVFPIINSVVLFLLAFLCLFPFVHLLALSFSSASAANMGSVWLLPVSFTTSAYKVILGKTEFWRAALVSLRRLLLGVPIQMLMTILAAYPLSKPKSRFRFRGFFTWLFFITMLVGGGMIPDYLLVRQLGMMDTIWALVVPCALPVYNMVILMNFYRHLPSEIEEAAIVDGENQWNIMWKIWTPLALPCIATLTLFSVVGHWNAWFDGIIYMNMPDNYPLQSYLRTVIQKVDTTDLSIENWRELSGQSERTMKACQIIVASIPVLVFYPFAQRYFVTGITLGGVKG
ncbi:MAG: carbohydrate ABC transporter permease [Christensenellales bacterium]|jgi:putative aldouronate transport system permease protein